MNQSPLPDTYSYDAITKYVDTLPHKEAFAAERHAQTLLQYHSRFAPIKQTVAIVPVAAHEETMQTVTHAVAQYARQTRCYPFTVVLGLNWPSAAQNNKHVETLVQQTHQLAKELQGALDVRVLTQQYRKPVIGRIRRDLWNAVLAAGMIGGTIREGLADIIGMNGDIDLVHMPRHAVGAIQSAMHRELSPLDNGYEYMIAWPRPVPMRHSASPLHPRSSAVMAWNDWLLRAGHLPYEAGLVVSMGRYAYHGGISADTKAGEVVQLWHAAGNHPLGQSFIPAGTTVTSGRRFMWRLLEVDADEVWSGDTFGADSVYRGGTGQFPDISPERQVELIGNTSQTIVRMLERGAYYNLAQRDPTRVGYKRVWQHVGRMLLTAERMLPRVLGEEWPHEEPFATARKEFELQYDAAYGS